MLRQHLTSLQVWDPEDPAAEPMAQHPVEPEFLTAVVQVGAEMHNNSTLKALVSTLKAPVCGVAVLTGPRAL
jgi:hypothetical protein